LVELYKRRIIIAAAIALICIIVAGCTAPAKAVDYDTTYKKLYKITDDSGNNYVCTVYYDAYSDALVYADDKGYAGGISVRFMNELDPNIALSLRERYNLKRVA
jgi:hypothetical protein